MFLKSLWKRRERETLGLISFCFLHLIFSNSNPKWRQSHPSWSFRRVELHEQIMQFPKLLRARNPMVMASRGAATLCALGSVGLTCRYSASFENPRHMWPFQGLQNDPMLGVKWSMSPLLPWVHANKLGIFIPPLMSRALSSKSSTFCFDQPFACRSQLCNEGVGRKISSF